MALRWRPFLAATIAVVAVAGCTVSVDGQGHGGVERRCPLSITQVPTCGVIWGVATDPNTRTYLQGVEKQLDRRFDMVYRFHDLNDPIPTDDERALVADGRTLHVSIDARINGASGQMVTWAAVAGGQYDATISAQARGIASLHVPVFVTFDHEPDQPQRAASGTPAEFIAAWRHVHQLFVQAKATNVVWVWVVTGDAATYQTAGQMWPGNAYVDWISWEAYNASGCRNGKVDQAAFQDFAASALPFKKWIIKHGPQFGIDTTKPMMISEAGSVVYDTDPALTAKWYEQIPSVLADNPQIEAVGLWDRPGNSVCRYQFDQLPVVVQAVSATGLQAPIRRK